MGNKYICLFQQNNFLNITIYQMTFSCNSHEYVYEKADERGVALLDAKFCEKLMRNCSLFIGPRESGKTNLMLNIAKCMEHRFDNIIYSYHTDKHNSVVSKLIKKIGSMNNQSVLLILDDYRTFDNQDFMQLLYNHKHYNITLLISVQTLSSLTQSSYCNIDNFFINKKISHSECQRLWSKIGNMVSNSFEDFKIKMQHSIESIQKHDFCYFGNKLEFVCSIVCRYIRLEYKTISKEKLMLEKNIFEEIESEGILIDSNLDNSKKFKILEKIDQIKKLCIEVEQLLTSD